MPTMQLSYGIAVILGFITCLSSFMLGLGQSDYVLPMLMLAAAVSSFYLTDFRRIIRFGDWTVNILVLVIVFCTLGEILHNKGEDLALSIARVLVFVEMVLLFRGKETGFCWQILLISLLQVLVASALQQSILFGFLLLVYIFAGLCAFILIFLQQEHHYFRRHSFSRTLFDSFKSGFAERLDRGRLARIALMTLLTGPLTLVFSFSDSKKKKTREESTAAQKLSTKKILRSLFAVFPAERDNFRNRWETIDDVKTSETAAEISTAPSPQVLVPVPSGIFRPVRLNEDSGQRLRFPLLAERPSFFGGTMSNNGLEGGQRELFKHLAFGTSFALVFAVLLFCLMPRIGKIEFNGYPLKFGYDQWMSAVIKPVNSVGFREEVRLGSLGTVLPYHREVLSVKFVKYTDGQIPRSRDDDSYQIPYNEVCGSTLYLRGVALDTYSGGTWKPLKKQWQIPFEQEYNNAVNSEEWNTIRSVQQAAMTRSFHPLLPGGTVHSDESSLLFFEDDTDLVGLLLNIQPLDTRVFFAPWPFVSRSMRGAGFLLSSGGRVEEMRPRRRELRTAVYSTAFRHGVQLAVVPCQETIDQKTLLQIPESGLENLKNLARQWDKESKCSPEDILGRAAFIEQKFINSGLFHYQLGGIQRDYNLDPLEDFVTKNRYGHCEYFAGAFVLMLRSVGIASRVMVGYKTEAADSAEKETVVRQSDAHTWADVYLPPEYVLKNKDKEQYRYWWDYGGWARFDPTPAVETTLMKTVSFTLTDWNEWIQTMWNNFVLNMNASRQMQWVYEPIQTVWFYIVDFFRNDVFQPDFWFSTVSKSWQYYRNLFKSSFSHWQLGDWGRLLLPVFILLPLGYLFCRVLYQLCRVFGWNKTKERQRREMVEFYFRLEQLLAKAGIRRQKEETPLELIARSDYGTLTRPVVEAFYRIRFGAEELDREEILAVQNTIKSLEKELALNPARRSTDI